LGKVVSGPEEGDGYVHTDIGYTCWENGRTTHMSYPIFITANGTKIDFRKGVWNNSCYSNTPIRFINFPVLKHHNQKDTGITCCIKNYLGVVDLSYFSETNFHYMSVPGMYGAVGTFMKTVRLADLNIVDATWITLDSGSFKPSLYSNTKIILAGIDPVALDYYAAKYILFPLSGNPRHNPDIKNQPLARQLREIWRQGIGVLDEKNMKIHSYDFSENKGQF